MGQQMLRMSNVRAAVGVDPRRRVQVNKHIDWSVDWMGRFVDYPARAER